MRAEERATLVDLLCQRFERQVLPLLDRRVHQPAARV